MIKADLPTSAGDISYTMALYLIDGLNINNHSVTGTDLHRLEPTEGSGWRVTIELADHGTVIEHMSRLGCLEAAEEAVRQVLQYLSESSDSE